MFRILLLLPCTCSQRMHGCEEMARRCPFALSPHSPDTPHSNLDACSARNHMLCDEDTCRDETSDERTILTTLSNSKIQHIDEDNARRTRSDCAHRTSHERPTRHMAWTYVILHYLGVERLVLHDSKSWSRRKSHVRQEFSTSDAGEPVCIRCCPANVSGASGKSGLTYLPLTWFCKCACICSTSPLG